MSGKDRERRRPLTGGCGSVSGDGVLGRGLRVLWRAIRDEPGVFAIAVGGSVLFSLLTIAGAFVVGGVVGYAVVPSLDQGHVTTSALAIGATAILAVSLG